MLSTIDPRPRRLRVPAATLLVSITTLLFACGDSSSGPPRAPLQAGDASLLDSSPFDGEDGVAIHREVILRFDAPLADGDLSAALGLRTSDGPLPTRVHRSADGKSLTLFARSAPLPAGSEILVDIDGDRLRSAGTGRLVDVDADGLTGGFRTLAFRTLKLDRVRFTDVCGRVFASEPGPDGSDVPLVGVTMRVDGIPELTTTTDLLGNFCLRDVPPGRIFVHIDGTTAANAPDGFYYPSVGKTWEASDGRRVTVGTVYLPAVATTALMPVSRDSDTTITMVQEQLDRFGDPDMVAALQRVRLTVPADSLFADDGSRGGSVGVAPVRRDRLPGALPPGLRLPLVLTVQTDGPTNFDQPAPLTLPNVADPGTGERLEAGAKSALWSFNHDTGQFEVVGPMTVSADGENITTDPGVGVRAPGWHGSGPGTPGDGGPPDDGPGCSDCCDKTVWDVLDDVSQAASTLWDCVADLTKISRAVRCVIDAVQYGRATFDWARDLGESLDENATRAELIALKNSTRTRIEELTDLINCGKDVTTGRAVAVVRCLDGIIAEMERLCDEYRDCTDIIGQDQACALIGRARPYAAAARDAVDALDRYLEDGIRAAAMTALNRLLIRVCEFLDRQTALSGGDVITPDEAEELRQLLRDVQAAIPSEADGETLTTWLQTGYLENLILSREVSVALGELSGEVSTRTRNVRFDYLVEAPVDDPLGMRRGSSSSSGALRILLPSRTDYRIRLYDPTSRQLAVTIDRSAEEGRPTRFPRMILGPASEAMDTDQDGLPDIVEPIYRADPTVADTDGDGTNDGDEVHAGTDPNDGNAGAVGLLAEVDTGGPALDVCALDGAVAVALGDSGIEIFNAYQGLDPVRIARAPTPAAATRVACSTDRLAVAASTAGLAVYDLSVPGTAALLGVLQIGDVRAVAASPSGFAYAGTDSGRISLVDLGTATELGNQSIGQEVRDVQFRGELIYALADDAVVVLRRSGLAMAEVHRTALQRSEFQRLFAGSEGLVATHVNGFVYLDLTDDPSRPTLVAATDTQQRGWRQLVLDGSGFGLGVVSPNRLADVDTDLHLYDLRSPHQPGTFLRRFGDDLLADAEPWSIVSYDGIAYMADRRGKLLAFRYRDLDLADVPPAIDLVTEPESMVEEGALVLARAAVADDVQVRAVDFFVDGELLRTDNSYPFETSVFAPSTSAATELTLSARAYDTAGNDTETAPIVLQVGPDATPPEVLDSAPRDNGTWAVGQVLVAAVTFSEPVTETTLTRDAALLTAAGADGVLDTTDDEMVTLSDQVRYDPILQTATWASLEPLSEGPYRFTLSDAIADSAGNALVPWSIRFEAVDGLRMRMFGSWTSSALVDFFAGRPAETFTVLRSGQPAQQTEIAVVPNVDFSDGSGAFVRHRGLDGVAAGSSSAPGGDDIGFRSPGSSDNFAFVVEGVINFPVDDDYVFFVDLDDQVTLQIDGQSLILISSGCRVATAQSQPTHFTAGPHALRIAIGDACPCCVQGVLRVTGGGLTRAVVPPAWFGN